MTKAEYIEQPVSSIAHPFRSAHARLTHHRSLVTHHSVRAGFTLLELLIVIGIIGLLLVLIAPAFTYIKGGTDVTSAAYTIQGVLDTARTYAKANNTYTWVGFFEEDEPPQQPAQNPAASGIGRVVMSVVASSNGTMLYTGNLSNNSRSNPLVLDSPTPAPSPVTLTQVGKLTKIDNAHLTTFPTPTPAPPFDTFDTRPIATTASRIGDTDTAPPDPSLVFHYPLFSSDPQSQYKFQTIVQFSPRGEAVVTNSNYTMAPVSEIGVEPTHGAATPSPTPANRVAIQFTGFGGNVKIYRK